jgi:Ca-activated chloride channel family protein
MTLLTDGETWDDEHSCRQLAEQARQMGVSITALGLGDEWNQSLLSDLADLSGGSWNYIDEPSQIVNAFSEVVSAMQHTVVTNASLILRLISGVKPRAVWRVSPLIDRLSQHALSERDVQVSLGDLQAVGQSVLVELTFPPRQAGEYRMAQAEVRYDVPAISLKEEKVQCDVIVSFTDDPQVVQTFNGRVMNIIEKVTAHKLQTRALDDAAAGNIEGATRKLRAAATRLLNMGEEEKAQQSLTVAQQIESGQVVSAGQTKKLTNATRKLDTSELSP